MVEMCWKWPLQFKKTQLNPFLWLFLIDPIKNSHGVPMDEITASETPYLFFKGQLAFGLDRAQKGWISVSFLDEWDYPLVN